MSHAFIQLRHPYTREAANRAPLSVRSCQRRRCL